MQIVAVKLRNGGTSIYLFFYGCVENNDASPQICGENAGKKNLQFIWSHDKVIRPENSICIITDGMLVYLKKYSDNNFNLSFFRILI